MEKILVIDDEKTTLRMFSLFLENFGYEMLGAESGEEGLEIFKKERPNLVLTDIKMPTMDGIEVLQRIKELAPDTEIIVITGHGDMDLALKALNLDAADFVSKPIKHSDLNQALERAKSKLEINYSEQENINIKMEGDIAILNFQGSITSVSDPFIKKTNEKLQELRPTHVVLSFSEHISINGAGLDAMSHLLNELHKKLGPIHATGLSENFREIFQQLGLLKDIVLHESLEEALESIKRS